MSSGNAVRLLRSVAMKLRVSDTQCHAVAACVVQWVRGSNAARSNRFFSSQKRRDWHWAHKDSYGMGTGVVPRDYCGRGVKLKNHLHQVTRIRMVGAGSCTCAPRICIHDMPKEIFTLYP